MRSVIQLFVLLLSTFAYSQHGKEIDVLHADVNLEVYPQDKRIEGSVTYRFKKTAQGQTLKINAREMDIHELRLNGKKTEYTYQSDTLEIPLGKRVKNNNELRIRYTARPDKAVYFIQGVQDSTVSQVWTQGQGKYSSNWIPSFDDMEEKVEFDLTFTAPATYELVANGSLQEVVENGNKRTWVYDMSGPMSSYLLAFAMGDYTYKHLSSSGGTPIQLYYRPADSLEAEPTYRYTREIFDFLEAEIGVPYPWEVYKQVPVRDFMYAGMENTTLTIFSDRYVVDSVGFNDQNYVNVNAHELAHHWFGNLVTEVGPEDHWLHEGFATYYAYLAEKEIFGDDYFYWKLLDNARLLKRLSDNEGGESLLDPAAGSTTFYEKGAWALFALRNEVGDEIFKKGIKEFLKKYRYDNVTVNQFLGVMEEVSGKPLTDFHTTWLAEEDFPYRQALQQLRRASRSISCYLELRNKLIADPGPSAPILNDYWEKCDSPFARARMLRAYFKSMDDSLQLEALQSSEYPVQRAAAEMLERPVQENFDTYFSLLDAPSYIVQEVMLAKLWIHFPEKRLMILEKMKNREGLPDKNLRIFWLTLAVITPGFEVDNKQAYLEELASYTAPGNGQETRQAAFQALYEIREFDKEQLHHLLEATGHHAWQFRKFANSLIDSLVKYERYRSMFEQMLPHVSEANKSLLMKKLNTQ